MQKVTDLSAFTLSVISGFIASSLGGYDSILKSLLFFVVIDFLTGVIKSIITKKLSSKVSFVGILKKLLIFIVVSCAVEIQKITQVNIPLRESVIMFYIGMEGISIIENVSEYIPLPTKLKDIFEQLKEEKE